MDGSGGLRFWEQPVVAEAPANLAAMPLYRMGRFPAAGPVPWLDRPDAEEQIDRRLAAGEITTEEATLCRKWARDGYLIVEGFYSAERLDEVWAAYEAALAAGEVEAPAEPLYDGDPLPGRVANAHFAVPAVDQMLFEPRMGHLVSVLLGAAARPFQTIIGHKSSQQLEHSDSIHMSTYPVGYLAANWIAFEDVHADAGPLVYYPGSHRLPYLMSDDLGIPPEINYASYERLYEPAVQALIADRGLPPSVFLPKKGDVLLWHANLLHGGSKVRDVRRSRKALVCHFFAQGAVCYHDLTGVLAHTQLGIDLYRYGREGTTADPPAPRGGLFAPPGLLWRVREVMRREGPGGLVRRVLRRR
jgi:hypothetical protein